MALIQCPECGKEISDSAKSCPNCGNPITSAEKKNIRPKGMNKNLIIVVGIIVIIVVAFVLLLPTIKMVTLSPEQKYLYQVAEELRGNLLNADSLQIKEAYVKVNPKDEAKDFVAVVVISYSAQNQGGGYTGRNAAFYVNEDSSIKQWNDRSGESSNEAIVETLMFDKALYDVAEEGKELTVEQIRQVMKMF